MRSIELPLPLLGAVAATRGMLGMGAGLLIGRSLRESHRKRIGWALVAIGALSTLPLALDVISRIRQNPA
jgi:hypothetical protein